MLHKLKGRFLSTEKFYSYEELGSFIMSLVRRYGREGIVRFQVFPDSSPHIAIIYVTPSNSQVHAIIYDADKESLVSGVDPKSLRDMLSSSGQAEAYFLGQKEFDIDMEIINFRATLDGSSNYLLVSRLEEILPQNQSNALGTDAGTLRNASGNLAKPSAVNQAVLSEDPLYSLLEEVVSNELSKVVEDPMFLARVLMSSKNPVVSKVPSSDAKSLIVNVIRTSKNRMLTCMFEDGLLCHIYINKSRNVGLCVTNGEGNKVCGRDALKFFRRIEGNVKKVTSNGFTTVMMYDLEA